jgi:hypothetical protein
MKEEDLHLFGDKSEENANENEDQYLNAEPDKPKSK